MAKALSTYQRAYEACDPLFFEEGRFPTIEKVRDRIQVNSPAVIKRAMNDWTLHFVERHRRRIERPDLPESLIAAAESLWHLAQEESEKTFEKKNQALAEQEKAWVAEREALKKEMEASEAGWAAEREKGEGAEKQWRAETQAMTVNREQLAQQRKATEDDLRRTREQNAALTAEVAALKTALVAQREEYETRSEKQTDWYLTRIEAEKAELEVRQQKALESQEKRFEGIQSQVQKRFDALEFRLKTAAEKQAETDQQRVSAETQVKEKGKLIERLDRQIETEKRGAAEKMAGLEKELAELRKKTSRQKPKAAGKGSEGEK